MRHVTWLSKLEINFPNKSSYTIRANWEYTNFHGFYKKNLTSAQVIVRGDKMKEKRLLPTYSFINYLTNIC